ncbi:serpin family protein [Haliangium sp.]|uniref:serpin family protein n=1 Tax=Haliangium sp. TaxID=2663208 RepID=UPI003D129F10
MRTDSALFGSRFVVLGLALAAVPVGGCSGDGPTSRPGTWVASEQQRAAAPTPSEADVNALRRGNLGFAAGVYDALRESQNNLVFSPISVSLALAMLHGGARGETEAQMAQALHFELPPERLHPAFNWLEQRLSSREADDDALRLRVVNASFGQEGYTFVPEYLDLLAENYGAGVSLLDFAGAPEASRQAINDWVGYETYDRIPALLPPGSVTPDTVLALVNAIYFKADWMFPFSPERTSIETFHAPDGEVQAAMMHGRPRVSWYTAGDDYQALGLAYRSDGLVEGRGLDMVFVLPEEGGFEGFEARLDGALLAEIVDGLEESDVLIDLPRFSFGAGTDLRGVLAGMGMSDAFDGQADFSGINGRRDLYVSELRHDAFISVNETGTEAAAATVIIAEPVSLPIRMTFDRPFLFLVRDVETGALLFLGRVMDPTA